MEQIITNFDIKQKNVIAVESVVSSYDGHVFVVIAAIDTGTYEVIISKKIVEYFLGYDLSKCKEIELTGTSGKRKAHEVKLNSICLGNIKRNNFIINATELPNNLSVDAILGRKFFEQTVLIFDFEKGYVKVDLNKGIKLSGNCLD
jgi:predicted aspartyl protease